MKTKFAVVVAAFGIVLAGSAASVGAHHAFSCRVRFQQALEVHRHDQQDGMDQSPCVAAPRRQRQERPDRDLGVQAGTPNVLFRRGVTKESVKIGMEVTVDGYQAKDGSHRANGRDLVLSDGRTMFLGSTGTGAPYELNPTSSKP